MSCGSTWPGSSHQLKIEKPEKPRLRGFDDVELVQRLSGLDQTQESEGTVQHARIGIAGDDDQLAALGDGALDDEAVASGAGQR